MRSIFLQGVATGQASFETENSIPRDWSEWRSYKHPDSILVHESTKGVTAWAALAPTSQRRCYQGVAEVQLYVAESCRGQGLGQRLLDALIDYAEARSLWTLQAIVFPENQASLGLFQSRDFRLVGRRENIARMNGIWRDTLLLERRSPNIY
ncbi:GNAT family N-acetyltransferase [Gammaproteobacteria bacterium AB-CW1]|uniref:GNAT family N-acetyltransferase n=1 Tax=Natronospira elongata TaxID=3110268 RepID=A0AAP6MJV2_9GAMM|nr:GNAT family N-acetyltransferase [Gammaproteobacteria bacterium AB-CW1]